MAAVATAEGRRPAYCMPKKTENCYVGRGEANRNKTAEEVMYKHKLRYTLIEGMSE